MFYFLYSIMRSLRFAVFFSLCCLLVWTASAQLSADTFITQFHTLSANLSLSEKKAYYLKVYNSMSLLAIRNRNDSEKFTLYTSLKNYIQSQITSLWTGTSSVLPTSFASWMTIPKVDMVKVREVRLSLHNTERTTKKLTPFTYNSALEWTAVTWANHLATLGKATHKRTSADGYYSYANIKTWFLDQWIVFAGKEKNGQALFTENLGRWYYTCKKTDCTDDFVKAIKTTRAFFMSEKWKSYKPHYNALVGDFSHIGLWVAVSGNKYYLVTHYTQALK